MKKRLFYPALWGVLTLSVLSSCRTEDGAITQKQVEDKRFAVFIPKDGKVVNYANGFAYLMKRYDNLHKTNLSGINNKPIIGTLASNDKSASVFQNGESYVEFNVRSIVKTTKNGEKWVVFPKVKNNKVIGLVTALLTEKETYVSYHSYGEQDALYILNAQAFQKSLDLYLKRSSILSLNASIKPMAASGDCTKIPDPQNENGIGYDCGIPPVEIVVPKHEGGDDFAPPFPFPDQSGPDLGGGCLDHTDCSPTDGGGGSGGNETVFQDQDPCSSMKTQKESTDFKNSITDLKGKTGQRKETGYTQNGTTGKYDYQDNANATETANSLRLPDAKQYNIKSYSHTHVDDYTYTDSDGNEIIRTGIKMFSPADVSYLMDMLQNAKDRGINFSDVSGTMVTSLGTYTIRFTGNEYQLKSFTETQVSDFTEPYKTFMTGNSNLSLEQKFLQFIDSKMNVKGVQLFKLNDDGTTTKTELNSDKTSVSTSNCP